MILRKFNLINFLLLINFLFIIFNLRESPKNKNFLKFFSLNLEVFSIINLLIYQYFGLNSVGFLYTINFLFSEKKT